MPAEIEPPQGKPPVARDGMLSGTAMCGTQDRRHRVAFGVYACVLGMVFHRVLAEWISLGWHSGLLSYTLLIPVASAYFVWLNERSSRQPLGFCITAAVVGGVCGAVLLTGYAVARQQGWGPSVDDRLAVLIPAFVCFLIAGFGGLLGRRLLRVNLFPLLFLFIMAPLPDAWLDHINLFYQRWSAEAANLLFTTCGVPVFRQGMLFQLPGISIEVAEECSGIRSSLVLFITSIMGGYLLLRSPMHRAVLALAVIPLGILRNGLRIFTIATLSSYVNPEVIHSPLHHHGGPLFFALSMIPFLALTWILVKIERRKRPGGDQAKGPAADGNR